MELVGAHLARRARHLGRLQAVAGALAQAADAKSAGQVQSVALRLIVEREMSSRGLKSREYWTVKALLVTPRARPTRRVLQPRTGRSSTKFDLGTEADAQVVVAIRARARRHRGRIRTRDAQPGASFMTSKFCSGEASHQFGFGARQTMNAAQRLYEAGYITYMRTDLGSTWRLRR